MLSCSSQCLYNVTCPTKKCPYSCVPMTSSFFIVVCVALLASVHAQSLQTLYAPYNIVPPIITDDTRNVNLGVHFSVNTEGSIVGCSVYRGYCINYQACTLFNSQGEQLRQTLFPASGQPTVGGEMPPCISEGWFFQNFSQPFSIVPGTEYTISVLVYGGGYSATNYGFVNERKVGNITVPANGGVYSYLSMPMRPTNSYLSTEYYVSPIFAPTPVPTPSPTPKPTVKPTAPPTINGEQSLYAPTYPTPSNIYDFGRANRGSYYGVNFTINVAGNITGIVAYVPECGDYSWASLYAGPDKLDHGRSNLVARTTFTLPRAPCVACLVCSTPRWCNCTTPPTGMWAKAYFDTPIRVNTSEIYIVSIKSNSALYASSIWGFNQSRTVGNIHAPQGAGLYNTPYRGYSLQNDQNSEYFISPLFVSDSSSPVSPTTITTSTAASTSGASSTTGSSTTGGSTPSSGAESLYGPDYNFAPANSIKESPLTVGLKFYTTVAGNITGVAAYVPVGAWYRRAHLYRTDTATLLSTTSTEFLIPCDECLACVPQISCSNSPQPALWSYATFNPPIIVEANTYYTVSIQNLGYSITYPYLSQGFATTRTVGHIVAEEGAGVFFYSLASTVMPKDTYQNMEYFVSPLFVPF